jgi:hypothetical protein
MLGAAIPPVQGFPGTDTGGGGITGVAAVVILACAVLVTYLAAGRRAGMLTSDEEPTRAWMEHRDRALAP